MAKYQGSVTVTGFIAPTDTGDTYATHDSVLGVGGLREVDTLILRDAISDARRRVGMLVYVIENKHYYALIGDTTNLSWKDLGTSLGGVDELADELDLVKNEVGELEERIVALESVKPVYEIAISMSSKLEAKEVTFIHIVPYDLEMPEEGIGSAYALSPATASLVLNLDGEMFGTIDFTEDSSIGVITLLRETPLNKNSILTIVAPDTVTELADVGVHLTFIIREED